MVPTMPYTVFQRALPLIRVGDVFRDALNDEASSTRISFALIQKRDPEHDVGVDVWDSSAGHQGFISALFTSNVTHHEMYTMNLGSSILSSSLEEHPENAYLYRYRPEVFETVHFTKHKPFVNTGRKIKTSNPVTCGMLREWKESVKDAPKERLTKMTGFLRDCPKEVVAG